MQTGHRQDLARVLFNREQIAARVHELGGQIARDYGSNVTVVPVMSGSIMFAADLVRELPLKMKINVVTVSSYAGPTTVGAEPKLLAAKLSDLADQPVLVIDDILDTGRTLKRVCDELRGFKPASVKIAVLLDKPARRVADIKADYVGFEIPDEFVVGYGLDFNGLYRNLPEIGILRPEMYR